MDFGETGVFLALSVPAKRSVPSPADTDESSCWLAASTRVARRTEALAVQPGLSSAVRSHGCCFLCLPGSLSFFFGPTLVQSTQTPSAQHKSLWVLVLMLTALFRDKLWNGSVCTVFPFLDIYIFMYIHNKIIINIIIHHTMKKEKRKITCILCRAKGMDGTMVWKLNIDEWFFIKDVDDDVKNK